MNQELQNKTFTITGMSSRGVNQSVVHTLEADKEKFQFWDKKQDGSETKAYQQFKQFRFQSGDQVTVAYKSEPQSFTNQQGKVINFNRNTIVFFKTDAEGNPEQSNVPQEPQSVPQSVPEPNMAHIDQADWERLVKNYNHLGKKFKETLDRIDVLEKQVKDLILAHHEDPAYQLHTTPTNKENGDEIEKAMGEKKAQDKAELNFDDVKEDAIPTVPF